MMWNIVSDSSCDLRMAGWDSPSVRFETVPLRIQVGTQRRDAAGLEENFPTGCNGLHRQELLS